MTEVGSRPPALRLEAALGNCMTGPAKFRPLQGLAVLLVGVGHGSFGAAFPGFTSSDLRLLSSSHWFVLAFVQCLFMLHG